MGRYLGVDLHKTVFTVCFLEDETGEYVYKDYHLSRIERFKSELDQKDVVGVESTGNTRYFVERIRDCVNEVKVINPSRFKVISQSVQKTDRRDALTIAEFLSKGMIPEIRMRDKETAQIKSLVHTRDKLVKLRTALKNKVHNILNFYGISIKRESLTSNKGLSAVVEQPVEEIAKVELTVIISQIKSLNQGIKKLDKEIEDKGKNLKGFKNITSIKGIGPKSGTILLSVIGNVEDFESEKKLASYFGIVPRIHISHETVHTGRITKQGSKLGRTTLVQCTLIAKKYSPYLEKFYQRIKAKKGSGKAIIATAKKLLGIIYITLYNDWEFEDFPNFVVR